VRELVAFETSGRLAKDVARLKYLPFQVTFRERYPSSWVSVEELPGVTDEEQVIRVEQGSIEVEQESASTATLVSAK